jgi:ABC-type nitrate/sulfonate/bicarbonate transport system permease component
MANTEWLFKLRGEVKQGFGGILLASGLGFIVLIWFLLTSGASPIVPAGILPSPIRVLTSFSELLRDNELIKNIASSYALNLGGYIKALLWVLPIGFLIGLIPLFRGMFLDVINAFRFVPLTAVTSLFIVWFGIGTAMKMNFLAFGLFIYLLPTIIQRIDEVDDVYLTSIRTLGANKWQTFTNVYWPAVMSKLSDDIRVLTAISWTYIIVIENIGANGGIGFLMHGPTARQGRVDKMFALLIIVMLIGVVQDKLFLALDKLFFPHKYQIKDAQQNGKESLLDVIFFYAGKVILYLAIGLFIILFLGEYLGILGNVKPLTYLFDDKKWVINLLSFTVLFLLGYNYIKSRKK